MQQLSVLVKTPKGLEEIEKRTHKLQGRLRAILFMVDGQRTLADLLEQAGSLAEQLELQLQELASQGFIEEVAAEADESLPPPVAPQPPPVVLSVRSSSVTTKAPASAPVKSSAPRAPAAADMPRQPRPVESIDVLKQKLSKMLTETMGMRAMFLGAQLESLKSQSELASFIEETARAVGTSNGSKVAAEWRARARSLIGL
jgi:DNA-binding FrmR family transcriptional regulator